MVVGCETVPPVTPPISRPPITTPGVYHRVEKGQTLWRISKIYDVDLDVLLNINRISDVSQIEVGQMVFIPNRKAVVAVVPQYYDEDFIWPAQGRVMGSFDSALNRMMKKGINIYPSGNLDVLAARSGRVVFCSDNFGGFGKTVIIDHGDGFSTVYARNAQVLISLGQAVNKGKVIAKIGSSPRDKNIYLHFEIRKRGIAQNPYFYLP